MTNKAIFLDRDDTLIVDPGYINNPDQVKLLPGVVAGLREFRKLGYKLIIVSNQSGIARGMFTEPMLAKIHERLKELLAAENAYIDRIYYCPYFADGAVKKYRKDSDMRKPKPGMLLKAAEEMDINLKKSWMVGNAYHDIAAGRAAKCKTILIQSHAARMIKGLDDPDPDYEAINLIEAANIVKREITHPAPHPKPEPKPAPAIPVDTTVTAEPAAETQEQKPIPPESPPVATEHLSKADKLEVVEAKLLQETDKTEKLLEEIRNILKSRNRQDLFHEFSVTKMMAGILQVAALFCLLVTALYKMSPANRDSAAFTALGFAIVFQLMALSLYIMNNDSQ